MPSPHPSQVPDDRLLDLLDAWQQGVDSGREPTPEELCPDDPALRKRLREHIASAKALDPHRPVPDPIPVADWGEGETFGRFRVRKKLGQGGMGAVYLVHDAALDREIALKVLLPGSKVTPGARLRFLREARAAAKIKSDHVVTIYDVGEVDDIPFIAMEHLLGNPLDRHLREKGELPLDQALQVARETALGLAAAHALGVVHRDVKPGNLWLEKPHDRVKLLDFGLARADGDAHLTGPGAVLGTPAFMSPEQGRGQKLDHRTDLFSLGVVLYRLVTGRMPFTGDTAMAVLTSLAVDTPRPLRDHNPDVPEALEAVVARLLAKDPDERASDCAAIAAELEAIEHRLTAPVVHPVPLSPPDPWEDIETTPAADAETLPPDRTPEEKPPAVPSRPRWLLPAAGALGAALLVALVVLAADALFSKANKEADVEAKEERKKKEGPPPPPPPPPPDHGKKGVEKIVARGGRVFVRAGGRAVTTPASIPPVPAAVGAELASGSFRLTTPPALAGWEGQEQAGGVGKQFTDAELSAITELGAGVVGELHLIGQSVSDDGASKLLAAPELQKLRLLVLTRCNAGDETVRQAAALPDLTMLVASGTRTTDNGVKHLAAKLPQLTRLRLADTAVSDESLPALARGVALADLDLKGTRVTEAGAKGLAEKLPYTWLRYGDGKAIKPAKPSFSHDDAVNVLFNRSGRVWVDGTPAATREAVKSAVNRVQMRLASGPYRAPKAADAGWDEPETGSVRQPFGDVELWQLVSGLRAYDYADIALVGQKVTDDGIAALVSLPAVRRATTVEVSHCGVTDATVRHLAALPAVATLSLNDTQVGDAGVKHLLARTDTLSALRLANTGVTDAAVPDLERLTRLTLLDLKGTKVSAAAAKRLAAARPACAIRSGDGTVIPPSK